MRLWKREIFHFSVAGSFKNVLSRVAQFTSIGDCVFECKESAALERSTDMGIHLPLRSFQMGDR
jgi:hypothetical protein